MTIFFKNKKVLKVFIFLSYFVCSSANSSEYSDKLKDLIDNLEFIKGNFYNAQNTCESCVGSNGEYLEKNPQLSDFRVGTPICKDSSYQQKCSDILKFDPATCSINDSRWQEKLSNIYNMGVSDCYCCSNPSMCLLGGFSNVMTIMRGAGIVGGAATALSIQKHCDTMKKVQHAAAGLDGVATTKCGIKAFQCNSNFKNCITALDQASTVLKAAANCIAEAEEKKIDEWLKKFQNGKGKKCGAIINSSIKQATQASANLLAAEISKQCADGYDDNDNDNDNDDDGSNNNNDAESFCSSVNIISNPQQCKEYCGNNASDPQCVDYCRRYEDTSVCSKVCERFPTASSFCGSVACQDRESENCERFCNEFSTHASCNEELNCIENPNSEACYNSPDAEVDCVSEPNNPLCSKIDLNSTGDLPPPEGSEECDDPLGCDNGIPTLTKKDSELDPQNPGPTTYSGSPGGGPGGGGFPSGGGTSGGGNSEGSEGELPGQDGEYDELLSGLSPQDDSNTNFNSRYSEGNNGDGGGSDFDLSKFLPKDKKGKKVTGNKKSKTAGPEDSIFDALSDTVLAYCGENQINCSQTAR